MLENNYFRFIKILIKETFGGNRTYLNQVFILEDISIVGNPINKNKIHTIYNNNIKNNFDKKRSDSPDLNIPNLSPKNKNNDKNEETEYDFQEMLPKFEDKKHSFLEYKDDINSFRNKVASKNNFRNPDSNYVNNFNNYENFEIQNINGDDDVSNINFGNNKNHQSEYQDFKRPYEKYQQYSETDGKIYK